MDEVNVGSFTKKTLKKLEDQVLTKSGVMTIFTPTGYKCPFDNKPNDRNRFSLAQHAKSTGYEGKSPRVRGSHKALNQYMMDKYADINTNIPGKNARQHARRKAAKKAKQARKLKEESGQEGGSEE